MSVFCPSQAALSVFLTPASEVTKAPSHLRPDIIALADWALKPNLFSLSPPSLPTIPPLYHSTLCLRPLSLSLSPLSAPPPSLPRFSLSPPPSFPYLSTIPRSLSPSVSLSLPPLSSLSLYSLSPLPVYYPPLSCTLLSLLLKVGIKR